MVPMKTATFGFAARVLRYLDGHLAQPFVANDLTADQESVALRQRGGKAFLDLAERAPAPAHPDLQRVGVLNGADVHPDALRARGSRNCHCPSGALQAAASGHRPSAHSLRWRKLEAIVKLGAGQIVKVPAERTSA